MTIRFAFIALLCCSCGLIATIKRQNYIESKGYDPVKDTTIIKPYEYYSKHKGFVPTFKQINSDKKIDYKINIVGYERSDTIPFDRLFQHMALSLDNNKAIIDYGEMHLMKSAISFTKYFGRHCPDTCNSNISFDFIKPKRRLKGKNDILLLWNVSIIKDSITYNIPSRFYYIK